jgi:hypothetical protein
VLFTLAISSISNLKVLKTPVLWECAVPLGQLKHFQSKGVENTGALGVCCSPLPAQASQAFKGV